MVHHFCALQNIKDTSRGNRYHNQRFKAHAENAGLECQLDPKVGWGVTKLGELGSQAKEELGAKPEVFKYLRFEEAAVNRKKRMKKWSCACYNLWSEASKEVKAVCLTCGEELVDG